MTIAFVIAVYNGAATLERTLDSLAAQTRRPDQVIVMDGGSTDGTQQILARRSDVVTLWRSEKDAGIYDAWNKALAHASAEWVAFLGSDDYLWDEHVLQRLEDILATVPADVPFVYGRLMEVDASGAVVGQRGQPWVDCKASFAFAMPLPHPGMLHRRSACFAAGGYDPRYRIAGDYALLRPVLMKHAPLFVDLVVAAAQEGGISTRADKRVLSVREAGRVITAAGERKPWRWYLMLFKNQLRHTLWRALGDAGLERVRRMVGSGARVQHPVAGSSDR